MTNESPLPHPVVDSALNEIVDQTLAADQEHFYWDPDPKADRNRQAGFPLSKEQGQLLYVLARAINATTIVEFATSIGVSTLYLAAAVRDNGGGRVIGTEIVPDKAARAQASLEAAGLASYVDIRVGDALETLRDLTGPVDLLLLDGWPSGEQPSIDRRVLDIVAPLLRPGALVFDDNHEADVLSFLRDPANGFRSVGVPLERGSSEIAVKVS